MDICGTLLNKQIAMNILVKKPYIFGKCVGFSLLTELHNKWIRKMVFEKEDMTLQAHRG